MPGGFNITSGEPIDSRMYVADIAHIYDPLNWANVAPYPGLIVSAPDGQVRVYAPVDGKDYTSEDCWQSIGAGAIVVEKYSEGIEEATTKTLGCIVYVTNNPETDATYPGDKYNGAYVVAGEGVLSKLGTVTVGDDIAGDVATLQGKVSTLEGQAATLEETLYGKEATETTEAVAGIVERVEDLESSKVGEIQINGVKVTPEEDGTTVNLSATTRVDAEEDSYDNTENDDLLASTGYVKEHVETRFVAYNTAVQGVLDQKTVSVVDNKPADSDLKSYTVKQGSNEVLTIESNSSPEDSNILKSYKLKVGEQELINIDIPKDLVVKSGSVITATAEDVTKYEGKGLVEGKMYIKLEINASADADAVETLFIPADSLVDVYTSGDNHVIIDSATNKITVNVAAIESTILATEGSTIATACGDVQRLMEYVEPNQDSTLVEDMTNLVAELVEQDSDAPLSVLRKTAESAIQSVESDTPNAIIVTADEEDSTRLFVSANVITGTDLIKIGTKDEVAGTAGNLVTARILKEYVDGSVSDLKEYTDDLFAWEIV